MFLKYSGVRNSSAEGGSVPADQPGGAQRASRRVGVPRRAGREAHSAPRRSARDGAAVAGFSARHEQSGTAEARFSCYLIGPLAIELCTAVEAIDKESSWYRWLFHYPRAATEPHCRGRYLGPMNHSRRRSAGSSSSVARRTYARARHTILTQPAVR